MIIMTIMPKYQIGDYPPESHVWDDGDYTDDTLNGTCGIDRRSKFRDCDYNGYSGNRILIIAGNNAHEGTDVGEIVIYNAIVVDIINID